MSNDITKFVKPLYDEYDSVVFNNKVKVQYWNPKTEKYLYGVKKSMSIIWYEMDYYSLMDNSFADVGKLFKLMQCINTKNVIVDKKNKPVQTHKDIAKLLNLNYNSSSTRDFIRSLFTKNIIKKDIKNKQIFLNPLVSLIEPKIHIDCYRMFREELKPLLTDKQRNDLERHYQELFGK